ncbi:MAG: methyltransferase domain-containing protein [Thermoanaerobaculia bacterium]
MRRTLEDLARPLVPRSLRLWLLRLTRRPPVGRLDWGQLRRLQPVSRQWGGDRGLPVDRYYIEKFLASRAEDIRGRVLEVGDNLYTRRFGDDRVDRSDVVMAPPGGPAATFLADFADAPELPSGEFDCVICTQTLQVVPDLPAAIATLHRILKPAGVLLATVPGISQLYEDRAGPWQDCWRFMVPGCRWLLEQSFSPTAVDVRSYGNVLAAVALLEGLAAEELTAEELDHNDPNYQLLLALRASKAAP